MKLARMFWRFLEVTCAVGLAVSIGAEFRSGDYFHVVALITTAVALAFFVRVRIDISRWANARDLERSLVLEHIDKGLKRLYAEEESIGNADAEALHRRKVILDQAGRIIDLANDLANGAHRGPTNG